MGNRVMYQLVSKDRKNFSPVVYKHNGGDEIPFVVAAMQTNTFTDFEEVASQLVCVVEGRIWNTDHVLTEEDNPEDAGVVLLVMDEKGRITAERLG